MPVTAMQVSQFKPQEGQSPVLVLSDGSAYYGDVQNNVPHGCGIMLFKVDPANKSGGKNAASSYSAGDRYGGEWAKGQFEGQGVLVTSSFTYQGAWSQGKMHGKGHMSYAKSYVDRMPGSGGVFDGGVGTLLLRGLSYLSPFEDSAHKPKEYIGDFDKVHHRHGYGLMRYYNGDVYEGNWSSNRRHGHGKLLKADGEVYDGLWERDERHGYGTIQFPNGAVFKGLMDHDVRNGEGAMRFANGDEYTGSFRKDYIEGTGTMRYRNGDVYEGEWHEGMRSGHGKYTLKKKGATVEGHFVNGLIQGEGTVEFPGVSKFIGTFERGERSHGTMFWYPSNAPAEPHDRLCYQGEWAGDFMHGKGVMWYTNGNFFSGQFVKNRRQGPGNLRYADGTEYSGSFSSDVRWGTGLQQNADGSIRAGRWVQDQFVEGYEGEWNGVTLNGVGRLVLAPATFFGSEGVKGSGSSRPAAITSADASAAASVLATTNAAGNASGVFNLGAGGGCTSANTAIEYFGLFRDNLRDGPGVLWLPAFGGVPGSSGSALLTDEEARRASAAAQLQSSCGKTKGHGKSTQTRVFNTRHVIKAQWKKDVLECDRGVWAFPTGEVYVGAFTNGVRNDTAGRLWLPDGSVYVGEWELNAPCGTGTFYAKNDEDPVYRSVTRSVTRRTVQGGEDCKGTAEGGEQKKPDGAAGATGILGLDFLLGLFQSNASKHNDGDDEDDAASHGPRRFIAGYREHYVLSGPWEWCPMSGANYNALVAPHLPLRCPVAELKHGTTMAQALDAGMRRDGGNGAAAEAAVTVKPPSSIAVGRKSREGVVVFPSGVWMRGQWLDNYPRLAIPTRPGSLLDAYIARMKQLHCLPAEYRAPSQQSRYSALLRTYAEYEGWSTLSAKPTALVGALGLSSPHPYTASSALRGKNAEGDQLPRLPYSSAVAAASGLLQREQLTPSPAPTPKLPEAGSGAAASSGPGASPSAASLSLTSPTQSLLALSEADMDRAWGAAAQSYCSFCGKEYNFFRTGTQCTLCMRSCCASCLGTLEVNSRPDVTALVMHSYALLQRVQRGQAAPQRGANSDEADQGTHTTDLRDELAAKGVTSVDVCTDCIRAVILNIKLNTLWIPTSLFASVMDPDAMGTASPNKTASRPPQREGSAQSAMPSPPVVAPSPAADVSAACEQADPPAASSIKEAQEPHKESAPPSSQPSSSASAPHDHAEGTPVHSPAPPSSSMSGRSSATSSSRSSSSSSREESLNHHHHDGNDDAADVLHAATAAVPPPHPRFDDEDGGAEAPAAHVEPLAEEGDNKDDEGKEAPHASSSPPHSEDTRSSVPPHDEDERATPHLQEEALEVASRASSPSSLPSSPPPPPPPHPTQSEETRAAGAEEEEEETMQPPLHTSSTPAATALDTTTANTPITQTHVAASTCTTSPTTPQPPFTSSLRPPRSSTRQSEVVVYSGYTSANVPHLCGEMWWGNAQYYCGGFRHGERHGFGMQYMANGERYVGMFAHNKWEGEGSYFVEDGSVLQGRFKRGKLRLLRYHGEVDEFLRRHGRGVSYAGDGSTYNGEWVRGIRHGLGIMQLLDGTMYSGSFVEGRIEGRGKLLTGTSAYYGPFLNGKRHGKGLEFFSECAVEGTWANDVSDGFCRIYDSNTEDVYETTYRNGNERDDCFSSPMMQTDEESVQCGQCGSNFSLFLRRHHCRLCGGVFCDGCTQRRVALPPHFHLEGPQRVCDVCFRRLEQRRMLAIKRYRNGAVYAGCWSQGRWVSRGVYCRPDGIFIVMDQHGRPLVPNTKPNDASSTTPQQQQPTTSNGGLSLSASILRDASPSRTVLDAFTESSTRADIDAFTLWWATTVTRCQLRVVLDVPLLQRFHQLPSQLLKNKDSNVKLGSEVCQQLAAAIRAAAGGKDGHGFPYPNPPAMATLNLFVTLSDACRTLDRRSSRSPPAAAGTPGEDGGKPMCDRSVAVGASGTDMNMEAAALRAARYTPAIIPRPPPPPALFQSNADLDQQQARSAGHRRRRQQQPHDAKCNGDDEVAATGVYTTLVDVEEEDEEEEEDHAVKAANEDGEKERRRADPAARMTACTVGGQREHMVPVPVSAEAMLRTPPTPPDLHAFDIPDDVILAAVKEERVARFPPPPLSTNGENGEAGDRHPTSSLSPPPPPAVSNDRATTAPPQPPLACYQYKPLLPSPPEPPAFGTNQKVYWDTWETKPVPQYRGGATTGPGGAAEASLYYSCPFWKPTVPDVQHLVECGKLAQAERLMEKQSEDSARHAAAQEKQRARALQPQQQQRSNRRSHSASSSTSSSSSSQYSSTASEKAARDVIEEDFVHLAWRDAITATALATVPGASTGDGATSVASAAAAAGLKSPPPSALPSEANANTVSVTRAAANRISLTGMSTVFTDGGRLLDEAFGGTRGSVSKQRSAKKAKSRGKSEAKTSKKAATSFGGGWLPAPMSGPFNFDIAPNPSLDPAGARKQYVESGGRYSIARVVVKQTHAPLSEV